VTTTTLAAIVANYTRLLRAAAPTRQAKYRFDRAPIDQSLREFAARNPGKCIRLFEFLETGAIEDPFAFDPAAVLRRREATMSVTYPIRLGGFFGIGGRVDVESLIEADASQVRDLLFSSGNYLPGQNACFVTRLPLERQGAVWFQDFLLTIEHYEAQSLT
jgi:hypothetical protein